MPLSNPPTSKQRIVVVGPSAAQFKGGAAQFGQVLVERLQAASEVCFVSWTRPYRRLLDPAAAFDRVSKSSVSNATAALQIDYLNPLSWRTAAKQIEAFHPQQIIVLWEHARQSPVLAYLNARFGSLGAELVYLCLDLTAVRQHQLAERSTRLVLRSANRVVVHSRLDRATAELLVPKERVEYIGLPLFDFFPRSQIRSFGIAKFPERRLLYFGRIGPGKGLDILLEAVARVRDRLPDLSLCIAGEASSSVDQEGSLVDRVAQLGLENSVSLKLRYVPNEEVAELFEQADLAVFPYRTPSLAAGIAVALSFGVPTLGTAVGGVEDLIESGSSGYLVAPNDAEALAEGIVRYFNEPISRYSIKTFALRMSWSRYLERLTKQQTDTPIDLVPEQLATNPKSFLADFGARNRAAG